MNYKYNNLWYLTIRIFYKATVHDLESFENQTKNDTYLMIEATTFNKVIDKITSNEDTTNLSITNISMQNSSSMTKSDTDTQEKMTGIKIAIEFDFMFIECMDGLIIDIEKELKFFCRRCYGSEDDSENTENFIKIKYSLSLT